MKVFRIFLLIGLVSISYSCRDEEPTVKGKGYLSLTLSALTIDSSPTSGRTKSVSTDNFIVKIYRMGESVPILTFDPWSSAPDQIELETGEYYAEAQNLDPPPNAAFEQPWYYGRSENFTIDKEELKTIQIDCTLANFKVSFHYSQNVLDDFTDWLATATLVNEGDQLQWPKDDDREGYFITSPLHIEVYLEYTKAFTGELITRNFTTNISNPQPATHYRINVDAALANGQIVININVDDSFDVVDLELGDNQGGETVEDADGNVYPTVQIGDQVWMAKNLAVTQLNDGTPINNIVDATWGQATAAAYCFYNNDEATYADPYGAYYNFYTVETGKLCPLGWHVPSLAEWTTLENAIGGGNQGGKLKETGTDHWLSPNANATNETGFTGVGTGYRNTQGVTWFFFNELTYMWATETGQFRYLRYTDGAFGGGGAISTLGLTVRCVKD